ncbi:lysophospholipid acyltransferase family protein [Fluviispira multicolorata]|uniref:1-acyl-sn-glycerol-3-phosphate acyltransferase n=1 Tax=Fluviispira multicolorata TaxID=2654512 RepID=A0A833JFG1_9BACT|nr:1-acylglycerol-3-phosphate O-acyltransferase [Fluviispira multicolorata]KAB8033724.1 1-acylglycerol-3-phosphate O-acyltransferase [Fluviispira multicolorata]
MLGFLLKLIRYVLVVVLFTIINVIFCVFFIFRYKNPKNNYIYSRILSVLFIKLLGVKVEYRGKSKLKKEGTSVLIANHQSYFDSVIFGGIFPDKAVVMGKKSLIWLPIFGWIFFLCGNLFINRKNHSKAMDTMKVVDSAIQSGTSLWMFPEGTRSHGRGLNGFKKGAFYAAIQNQVNLQPIVSSTFKNAIDISKWNSGKVLVEVLEPIPTRDTKVEDIDSIVNIAHSVMKNKIASLDMEIHGVS